MSWLYSIVFAGLLFSSNNDADVKSCDIRTDQVSAFAIAVSDETEKFEQSYPITANGRVSVSNVNGSIVVEAWDRNEVRLEATKIADSRETLADVEIKVDSRPDSFSVEADYNNLKRDKEKGWKNHRKLEVQFRLSVPRTAILNEVETVNGSVTVSNFTNITKISAVNGNVSASNLRGAANLSTVNGEVTADFDRLETGSKIALSTVNGRVNLVIPSDANATIKADSLNGSITNDFGLPVRKGKYVGRDMYGRVGSGEVQIKLDSVNGGLALTRKNDGKSTNPAVNLLPQKNKDYEDWDDDDDYSPTVNIPRLNKDIARAVKNSEKHAAIGLQEAQKEINKIKPELEKVTRESIKIAADAMGETSVLLSSPEFKQKMMKDANLLQKETLSRIDFANLRLGAPFIEKRANSFAVKGIPTVVIEAKGCGVKVRGWDKPEIKYVLTEFAGRRSRVPITITEDHTSSGVNLKVTNNNKSAQDALFYNDLNHVRIEVFVPKKSNLRIVTDGEIRLEGVSGDINLDGDDESINIRDVDGKLQLSAADAQVRIIGFKGELDSNTVDGDIYLEGEFAKITGRSVDGSFILTVPENINADIHADVEDISVENLPVPKKPSRGNWRLGSGGPKYTFVVADGQVRIRSANTLTTRY